MSLRSVQVVLRITVVCLVGSSACTWVVWHGHSPDRRVHVVVREKLGHQIVFRDGKSDPAFDGISVEGIAFSDDGQHLAYPARRGDRWCLVLDGKPGPFWEGIGLVRFGPNAKKPVYAGYNQGQWRMVVDGRSEPAMDSILLESLTFSPDGNHVAYAGTISGRTHVVRDGLADPGFDGIGGLAFSADSGHLLYVARSDSGVRIVVDGQGGLSYDDIAEPIFDPLGQRLAYAAKNGQEWFIVLDGKEGPGFEAVGGLTFAASGKKFAYVGSREGRASVILDGSQGEAYEQIISDSLCFSPDGQHLAFVALEGGHMSAVLDGVPGPWSHQVSHLTFHPCDGKLLYVESSQQKSRLIMNGIAGPEWVWIGELSFGPGCRLGYLVRSEQAMKVLVDNQEYEVDLAIDETLVFSDDGRHWACLAGDERHKKLFVIIDSPQHRRPFEWEEMIGELQRIPIKSLSPTEAAIKLRRWVKAELELATAGLDKKGTKAKSA